MSFPTTSIPGSLQTPFFSDESESDHEGGLSTTPTGNNNNNYNNKQPRSVQNPDTFTGQVVEEEEGEEEEEEGEESGALEAENESEELEQEDDIQARDTLLNEQVIKSGYLLKRSQKRTMGRGWQKRWFVLRTSKLCYYKDDKEYKLLKVIDLRDVTSVAQVHRRKRVNVLGIVTNERKYYLQAPDAQTMQGWEEAIKSLHKQLRKTLLERASTAAAAAVAAAAAANSGAGINPSASNKPNVLVKTNTGIALVTSATTVLSPRMGTFSGKQISSVGTNDEQLLKLQSPTKTTAAGGGGGGGVETDSDAAEDDEDEEEDDEEVEVLMDHRPSIENVKKTTTTTTATTTAEDSASRAMKGVLKKKGSDNKRWGKRYFVLDNGKLAYHRSEQDIIPVRVILLSEIRAVQMIHPKRPKPTSFKFRVQTTERDYVLMARTQKDREAWCQAIMKEKKRLPSSNVKAHLLQAAH